MFISVADRDKADIVPIARRLAEHGLHADRHARHGEGVCGGRHRRSTEIPKIQEGRPNLIDQMKNGEIALVINTPSGRGRRTDEGKIRAAAVAHGVTCITTLSAAEAAAQACEALRGQELKVVSLQERFG